MAAAAQADRTERNAGGSSSRSLLRGRGRTIRCDPISGASHWNGSERDQLARSRRDRTRDREICGLPELWPHRDDERAIGGEVRRKRALNCWPWVRSLTHSPEAVIHSPAAMGAAWPTTVTTSRCPRALARRTQKPFSALW